MLFRFFYYSLYATEAPVRRDTAAKPFVFFLTLTREWCFLGHVVMLKLQSFVTFVVGNPSTRRYVKITSFYLSCVSCRTVMLFITSLVETSLINVFMLFLHYIVRSPLNY